MLIIILVLFLLLIILAMPLYFEVNYLREKSNHLLKINIFVMTRIWNFKITLPYINNYLSLFLTNIIIEIDNKLLKFFSNKTEVELEEDIVWSREFLENIKKILLHNKFILNIIKRTKLSCHHFEWKTEFGFHNPAVTGISSGLLWSFKSLVLTYIYNNMQVLNKAEIAVNPDFDNTKFNIILKSIISLRMGDIIFAVFYQFIEEMKVKTSKKSIKIKGDL